MTLYKMESNLYPPCIIKTCLRHCRTKVDGSIDRLSNTSAIMRQNVSDNMEIRCVDLYVYINEMTKYVGIQFYFILRSL